MARVALDTLADNDAAVSDPFYPEGRFMVVVNGTITGDIFVEIADRSDDLSVASSWNNAQEDTFDATIRQKVFVGSPGYAYRINSAANNMGVKVSWDYVYTSTVARTLLD